MFKQCPKALSTLTLECVLGQQSKPPLPKSLSNETDMRLVPIEPAHLKNIVPLSDVCLRPMVPRSPTVSLDRTNSTQRTRIELMTTQTAMPVGFRCTSCYQPTLAMPDDAGQSVPCMSCQQLNVVPPATEERLQAGKEMLAALQSQAATAPASPATPVAATQNAPSSNPYAETPHNPYASPSTYESEAPRAPGSIALASKTNRFVGRLIDGSISFVIAIIGIVIAAKYFPESPFALVVIYFPLLALAAYQWCYTATEGKTIGKFLMKTKVINAEGNPPGFVNGVILRSWCIGLLACIPLVGLIVSLGDPLSIFWSPANRCWHDKMAKTLVIQE